MGNRIRIKQIDLQGVFSASAQVDLLSGSNYVAFVNELNTTMSSDVELAAVSSSISQSIFTINQTLQNGLVSGSSQLTSSYDTRYVLSGSITQTTWDNISGKPSGLVSQSTDLSSINTFTQSIDSRVDNLESWSSSLDSTFATDLQVSIVSSSVAATIGVISQNTGLVSTSSFNEYTASQSTASLVDRLNTIESVTSSYETKGRGIVSGSSQLTGSFDVRYTLSGSVTQTTWDNISGKPSGIVSSSIQVLGGSGVVSGSYETIGRGIVSSSAQISGLGFITSSTDISSLNAFTASYFTNSSSFDSRITTEKGRIDAILSASTADADTFAEIVTLINSVDTTNDNAFATYYTSSNARISSLESVTSSYETKGRGIVSGSSQLTSSFDTRYTLSGSISATPAGTISGSSQLTASYDTRYTLSGSVQPLPSGLFSSSAQLPSGLVSGSSQLTASYDTRYTLSGSVGSTPAGTISGSSQLTSSFDTRYALSGSGGGTIPAGTISGSSQLTASYDSRYVQTGSFNSYTASINSFTSSHNSWSSSIATTGSNSFNGNQNITGSLTVTSGTIVASQITANTSSLYLTSGSNLYVQNNGLVEITGSLTVSGSNNINLVVPVLIIGTGSGDEGGEINLAKAVTNTTLTGSGVTVDVYRDRVRIFEQGGDARGVYIDLSKAPGGVAGELLWKASGIVNAGTFVTLDNIKAQVPASGNRGLSLATVSGTVTGYISGHYQGILSSSSGTSSTTSLSTTATSSMFSWNFGQQGDMSTYILRDDTNNRVYRIILIIGAAYNNNFISIERLY